MYILYCFFFFAIFLQFLNLGLQLGLLFLNNSAYCNNACYFQIKYCKKKKQSKTRKGETWSRDNQILAAVKSGKWTDSIKENGQRTGPDHEYACIQLYFFAVTYETCGNVTQAVLSINLLGKGLTQEISGDRGSQCIKPAIPAIIHSLFDCLFVPSAISILILKSPFNNNQKAFCPRFEPLGL